MTSLTRANLLKQVGLEEIMIERNFIYPFRKDAFHRYTSPDYLQSSNREMDEVYRMGEVVLVHKATGLRVEYLTTESYDGRELRYRCRDVFVMTKDGKRPGVTSMDLTKRNFQTSSGEISFDEVKIEP